MGRAVLGKWVAGILAAAITIGESAPPGTVFTGVDANYSLGMEEDGRAWRWHNQPEDLFQGIARQGVQGFRVRLWTGEEGPNGRNYATEVVRRALAAGLDPYLVIFLSEDWADLMKQPAPAIWKDLDLADRAGAIRAYARETVRHFRAAGLRSHLYEIGNEIDYGICGVYPGKNTKKTPESLARSCWPDAARLILAAQQGVREADPEARFLLHIAHWWDAGFCTAFYRFMLDQGVQVDFAGLSYFPSSNIGGSLEMDQFGDVVSLLHQQIKKPVIVAETAYPSTSEFTGQFSRWKKAAPGYPLTREGQKDWLTDFLDFCAHHPAIHSVYYWSPEWSGEGMWKAFALFDENGNSRPAWTAFQPGRANRTAPQRFSYLEVREKGVYLVPVEEARDKALILLAEEKNRFGQVNKEYIDAISKRELAVGPYQVALRASLSGNLDLHFSEDLAKPSDWREALARIPAGHGIVLFVPDLANSLGETVAAAAEKNGREVRRHALAPDQPRKFGLNVPAPSE